MKKKIALILTSLMILTALLTTSYYVDQPIKALEGPPYHWKIVLAQKNVPWVWIQGYLTDPTGLPIPGANFTLTCMEFPYGYVYAKVETDVIPHDIHFQKIIEGLPAEYVDGFLVEPIEGHVWYQDEEFPDPPWPESMVVVEVHDTHNTHEWQVQVKQHNCNVTLLGYLTEDGVPVGDFYVECYGMPVGLRSDIVKTDVCVIPNDIHYELIVDGQPYSPVDAPITQFPWRLEEVVGPGKNFTVEMNEVQMHRYITMGGWLNTAGQLGSFPPWDIDGWQYGDGVPFATRDPYTTPMVMMQNVTFTQKDPITGIVEISVPAESYVGLDHKWYSLDVGTWFRSEILPGEDGCGWIFTGQGKDSILGAVDYYTFNNYTGVYLFGADNPYDPENNNPVDDVLLAGQIDLGDGPAAGGAGPPLGPCLQQLRGPDGIPGTIDDPIGYSDIMYHDGPNKPGSSIMYVPCTMRVTFWNGTDWQLLFQSPWPQLLTTGTAYDIVNEPGSALDPRNPSARFPWHMNSTQVGTPWEFVGGTTPSGSVLWKHEKCNAYVIYVCVWSVLGVWPTELGKVDILFEVTEKKVRKDCVIADADCNQLVNILDILAAAVAFGAQDEYLGPDGIPCPGGAGNPACGDDKDVADPNWDARVDFDNNGLINILDILAMAVDFGYQITPQCLIRP